MVKLTIKNLAKYLKVSESTMYYKKKHKPKEWYLLWNGWKMYLIEKGEIDG